MVRPLYLKMGGTLAQGRLWYSSGGYGVARARVGGVNSGAGRAPVAMGRDGMPTLVVQTWGARKQAAYSASDPWPALSMGIVPMRFGGRRLLLPINAVGPVVGDDCGRRIRGETVFPSLITSKRQQTAPCPPYRSFTRALPRMSMQLRRLSVHHASAPAPWRPSQPCGPRHRQFAASSTWYERPAAPCFYPENLY